MSTSETVNQLIQGLQFRNTRLYDALRTIALQLDRLDNEQEVLRSAIAGTGTGQAAPDIVSATYYLTPRNVVLGWSFPPGVRQIEIRKGDYWGTADSILISSSSTALLEPLPTGRTTFLLKGIDGSGNYSANATTLYVDVPAIGSVIITADVIDNNVLLKWNEPSSAFEISYYEIKKGSTVVGIVDGTFITIFEVASGTYQYKIVAYDIAGNPSPETTVEAAVRQPPDYSLEKALTDDLSGTKTNVVISVGKLLCNLTSETWAQHFFNHSWLTIQDQIDAGYIIYAEPTPITGTYEKEFDAEAEYSNVIINLIWNQNQVVGVTTISPEICYADASHTFNSYTAGKNRFAPLVRYIKVKFTFTGSNDKALIEFWELMANLDVKREVDSGNVDALATDSGGTQVNFNKVFKDVDSITLVAESLEPIYPVYDFVDTPNPTGFKVLVFDSAGKRINKTVSWKARGIV